MNLWWSSRREWKLVIKADCHLRLFTKNTVVTRSLRALNACHLTSSHNFRVVPYAFLINQLPRIGQLLLVTHMNLNRDSNLWQQVKFV
jgi:hypothetical protein